jgi:hypothetical protein
VNSLLLIRSLFCFIVSGPLTVRRQRSLSITSHDSASVILVSQMTEAKKRILSMDVISLAAAAPPKPARMQDDEVDIFAESDTEEEAVSSAPAAPKVRIIPRPKSSGSHLPVRSAIEFNKMLRLSTCSSRAFIKQFQIQRSQRARKNAKSVFETLQGAVCTGERVVLSVHDYIHQVVVVRHPGSLRGACSRPRLPPPGRSGHGLASSARMSKKMKKEKAGMVLYVDPSIDTTDIECILHVSYGPNYSQTETITVANDGSYCGLELTGAKWNLERATPFISPQKTPGDFDLGRLAASFEYDTPERCLPGWNGTLPIFIPADSCRCRLETRRSPLAPLAPAKAYGAIPGPGGMAFSGGRPVQRPRTAPLAPVRPPDLPAGLERPETLEKLSIFCFSAASIDVALKTVNECVGSKLKTEVANDDTGGGTSSLSVAALHGNIEVSYLGVLVSFMIYL